MKKLSTNSLLQSLVFFVFLVLTITTLLLPALLSAQDTVESNIPSFATVPNDPTVGTTLNRLAVITPTGAVTASMANIGANIPVFLVVGNAGTTGYAHLALPGITAPNTCPLDSTSGTTNGVYYMLASTVTAGGVCHAQATSSPPSGGTAVIGYLFIVSPTVANLDILPYIFGGSSSGSNATSVNGAALPASASVLATNGAGQIISASGILPFSISGTAANATAINGVAVPAGATVIGSNSGGQLIAQLGAIANNTSGNANTATLAATASALAGGGNVTNTSTLHVNSGGSLICDIGSICPSNSLPSGSLGNPYVNTNGSTGGATSPLYFDASQEAGSTLDVLLNNANARAITNNGGAVDARALNCNTAVCKTIAAQVYIGELPSPVLGFSVGGGAYANGIYKAAYTLTSPAVPGQTSASSETTITLSGCSSNCTITMTHPAYPGTATSYTPYVTSVGGIPWSEDQCNANANTGIGSNASITAACAGAPVSTSNQGFAVALIPPLSSTATNSAGAKGWQVTITDGVSCGIKFFDQSSYLGNSSGEGRPFVIDAFSSSTSVEGIACLDGNPKVNNGSGAGYYFIQGLAAEDVSGDNVTNAVCVFRNTFDTSLFISPHCGSHSAGTVVASVYHVCCSTTFIDPQFEAAGVGIPLVIGSGGGTNGNVSSVNFISGSYVHSATGQPIIQITGNTGTIVNLDFTGTTYIECQGSNTVDLIQVATGGSITGPVHFDSVQIGGSTCGGSSAFLYSVGIGGNTVGHFSVGETYNGALTNLFRYPGSTGLNITGLTANSTYPSIVLDNNNPVTFLTNVYLGSAVQFNPTFFSSLAPCNAGNEGKVRAVTDSTTVVWGATITGGGANNVMAFCDAVNWTVMAK